MNNKKKNLKKGPILNEGPNGPDTYEPPYIQPPFVRATCHLHKTPMGFKTIEELAKHELIHHRVWKG